MECTDGQGLGVIIFNQNLGLIGGPGIHHLSSQYIVLFRLLSERPNRQCSNACMASLPQYAAHYDWWSCRTTRLV